MRSATHVLWAVLNVYIDDCGHLALLRLPACLLSEVKPNSGREESDVWDKQKQCSGANFPRKSKYAIMFSVRYLKKHLKIVHLLWRFFYSQVQNRDMALKVYVVIVSPFYYI